MMKKLGYLLLLVLIILTASCEIGLGSSVDTDPPTLEITTPPVDKIIRNSFAIGGTWSDDGTIAELSVQLNRTDIDSAPIDFTGIMEGNLREGGSGTWHADIHPFAEDGTKLVADGAYQAVVTIKDNVGRTTVQSTTFTVDNTPPVIVLTRPSTAADSKSSDTYGQTFNLEGQAADNNNVSLIEVRIYKDADCTEWVHTVPLKNVPNSINMDVAKFKSGDTENDYYKIYQNATTEGGAKDFYCQLVAYDGAVSYPIDRERTAEDELGNQIDTYYLYKDIATSILGNYKITEVYSILSGNFSEDTAARTIQPSGVIELLTNSKRSKGKFTLNPKNNPTFTVTTLTPLTKDESGKYAFTGNEIIAGGQAVIEVAPGLDGILLEEESLKVYAQKYESGALSGSRIYPPTTKQESGTSYKFIASINRTDGFEVGKTYIFGVEGYDQSEAKNAIEPAAEAYGFVLGASGRAPQITITSPTDTNSYINQNSMTFEGTVSVELGKPEINVYLNDGENPEATITDLTLVSSTADEEKYSFSWTYNKFGGTNNETSETIKFAFVANLAGTKSQSVEKTVVYDIEKPTIRINSIGPVVERNNRTNNINGTFKIQGMIQDNVQFKDAKLEVFQGGNKLTVYSRDELTTNGSFEYTLNTKELTDGSDIEILITGTDRANNTAVSFDDPSHEKIWKETYHIDQSTDVPVIEHQFGQSLDFSGSTIGIFNSNNGERKNIFSQSETMYFMVSDDDNLSGSSIKIQKCDSAGNVLASEVNVEADTFANNISAKTPADVGIYKVTLFAKDEFFGSNIETETNYTPNNFIQYEFLIKVTGKGPDVSHSYPKYVSTVAGAANYTIEFTINGEAPFSLSRNFDIVDNSLPVLRSNFTEVEAAGSQNISSTYSYTISYPQGTTEADSLKFRVFDRDLGYTDVVFNPGFDNDSPVLEIKSPKPGKTGTSALSETTQFSGTAKDAKSGTSTVKYKFVKYVDGKTIAELQETGDYHNLQDVSNGPFTIDIDFVEGILPQDNKLEEGSWCLFVKAADEAGNETNYEYLRFDINLHEPELEVTIPDIGSIDEVLADSNAEIIRKKEDGIYYFKNNLLGTITTSDTAFIVTPDYKVDDTSVIYGWEPTSTEDTWNWQTTGYSLVESPEVSVAKLTPGIQHKFIIEVRDRFGKTKNKTFTVYKDITGPNISITSPGNVFTNSVTIEGTVSDAGVGTSQIKWSTEQNGSYTGISYTEGSGTWSTTFNTSVLGEEGPKTFWFKAIDALGNVGTPQKVEFEYDKELPQIESTDSYSSTGTNYINSTNSSFVLEGKAWDSNKLTTVVVEKNDAPFENITSTNFANAKTKPSAPNWSKEFTVGQNGNLADGKYTFTVYAKDQSGRKSETEIKRSFTVDTVPPTITLKGKPGKENTKSSSYTFRGTAEDETSQVSKVFLKISSGSGTSEVSKEVEVEGTDSWSYEVKFADTTADSNGKKWSDVFASEGEKTVTLRALDLAENEVSQFTFGTETKSFETFTYDKANPLLEVDTSKILEYMPETGFVLTGTASDSYLLADDALVVTQTISGETGSLTKTIKKSQINGTTGAWSVQVPFNNAGAFVTPTDGKTYTYTFELYDSVGNKDSETPASYSTKVDLTKPVVTILTPDGRTGTNAISTSTFQFTGTYTEINISAIYYAITNASVAEPAVPTENKLISSSWAGWTSLSYGKTDWSFFEPFKAKGAEGSSKEEGNYKIYLRAVDKAGNISDSKSSEFDVDMAAPVITTKLDADNLTGDLQTNDLAKVKKFNFTITETHGLNTDETSVVVKKGDTTLNQNTNYKIKLGDSEITDLKTIEANKTYTVELIFPANATSTDTDAEYTFEISVKDVVGKTKSETRKILIDTAPPFATHEADASVNGAGIPTPKDLYFRVGSQNREDGISGTDADPEWSDELDKDVGAKYSNGTYGNDTSIEIRGRFDDSGSGVKEIFYKIYNNTEHIYDANMSADEKAAAIEALKNEVLNAPNGSFSLKAEETKRVFYTKSVDLPVGDTNTNKITTSSGDKYYKDITTNFREKLTGFAEGENNLVFVAVDNVGNSAVDFVTIGESSSAMVYADFSLNIDRTPPDLSTNNTETLYTKAEGTISLSGTVTDGPASGCAGVDRVVILHPTETDSVGEPKELAKATLDGTSWSHILDATVFENATGTTKVYAKAYDKAGSGNWTKIEVAKVVVDKTPPTISLDDPSDADESATATGIQVNGTIKLTGSASDTIGNENNTKFTVTKIRYKKSGDTTWTELTNDSHEGMSNFHIASSENFTVTGFDTTQLAKATYEILAVVEDNAGNETESESKTINVDQDSDKPVINLSNVTLQETGSSYLKNTKKLYLSVTDDDGVQSIKYKVGNGPLTTLSGSSIDFSNETDDGAKTIYFEITDKAGRTFKTTDSTNTTEKPKISDGTTTRNDGDLVINLVTKKPTVTDIEYSIFDAKETDESKQWSDWKTSAGVVGGTRFTKFKMRLKASSAQTISAAMATYNSVDYNFTCEDDTYDNEDPHIWTSGEIPVYSTTNYIGDQTIDLIVKDGVPNDPMEYEGTPTITVDNVKPTISISKPSTLIGQEETIKGTVDDTYDPVTLYYAVSRYCEMKTVSGVLVPDETKQYTASAVQPQDSERKSGDTVLATAWTKLESEENGNSWYVYFDDGTETDHTKKLGTYLTEEYLGITKKDLITAGTYEVRTPVYFWIKAVDPCGNEKIEYKKLDIDPQGERPRVEITYPTNVANVAPTLGGTIRMTGTAEDNNSAKYAWVQVDYKEPVGFSQAELTYLKEKGYKIGKISTNTEVSSAPTNLGDGANAASDYGIMVEVKGTGWSQALNANKEFNPESGTRTLRITVYATDEDSTPHKSLAATQTVIIDSNKPYVEQSSLELVQYNSNHNISARKAYSNDITISGIWYLTGNINDDDSGIEKIKYKGTERISSSGSEFTDSTDSNFWFKKVEKTVTKNNTSVTIYNYQFSVPLGTNESGQVGTATASFEITEKSDETVEPITPSYSVVYDTKAPVLNTDTTNSLVNLERNVQNSNGFYTFGAIASEDKVEVNGNEISQSGVDRIAFYFTRDLNYGLHGGSATNDLFDVMIYHKNTDADDIASGNMITNYKSRTREDGLYWTSHTGTVSGTSFTYTGTVDKNIHKNGLVKIHGTIYLIDDVSGNLVTLDSAPGDTESGETTSALFALCNVIDANNKNGTRKSDTKGYGYGYYTTRDNDDGDLITESFSKQNTDWIFDASINSKNLPDGPVTLHLVAFDKAGNIAEWASTPASGQTSTDLDFVVSNNAPRIAGMKIGTDENGNGKVDSSEMAESYSNQYALGYDKSGNEIRDLTLPVQIESATTPTAAVKAKGRTVIEPELVGGNGTISYKYKVYTLDSGKTFNGTAYYEKTDSVEIASGTTDEVAELTVQDTTTGEKGIILSVEDFVKLKSGSTTDQQIPDGYTKFEFLFSDSTPGKTSATGSSNSSTLNVIMDVALRDTTKASNWILPFYWKSSSDNSLFGESKDNGHIELAEDWVRSSVYSTSVSTGEFDADPKVSGMIKIEGIAHDETLLSSITVQFGTSMGGLGTTEKTIASYDNSNWSVTALGNDGSINSTTGWASAIQQATYGELVKVGLLDSAKVTDNEAAVGTSVNGIKKEYLSTALVPETSQKFGHVVHWILYVNTAKVSGVAAKDVTVTAKASDRGSPSMTDSSVGYTSSGKEVTGSGNSGAVTVTGTGATAVVTTESLTGTYKMDVVPYITALHTTNRQLSGLKDNNIRSASGKYSVIKGNTNNFISVEGFNLNPSAAIIVNKDAVKETTVTATATNTLSISTPTSPYTSFGIKNDISNSGYLELLVNGVRTLNNINYDDSYGIYTITGKDANNQPKASATDYTNYYNREADLYTTKNIQLTDDRYIRMWDMKSTGIKNGYYPTMIMEGNDPVFSLLNLSGDAQNAPGPYPAYSMPQRAKFKADGTKDYIEYLANASVSDLMGMARDDSGRFHHLSVFNRDGCGMYYIYDRFSELYDGYGWAPGIRVGDGWNYVGSYGNNGLALESVNYGGLMTGRYMYPKMIAKGDSKEHTASVYIAYYDDNTSEILMRDFMIGKTDSDYISDGNNITLTHGSYNVGELFSGPTGLAGHYIFDSGTYYLISSSAYTGYYIIDGYNKNYSNKSTYSVKLKDTNVGGIKLDSTHSDNNDLLYSQAVNFEENICETNPNAEYDTGRITAVSNTNGTKYYDIGIVSASDGYHVVLVYLDKKDNKLKLKYSTNVVDGSNPTETNISWTPVNVEFPDNVGSYVSMAVDGNSVHIAAFDSYDSNLVYMYLPNYNSTTGFKKITVDQASAVGNWTQIKVRNHVPYISYYNSTETGGRDCIKLAYPIATSGSTEVQNKEKPGVNVEPGTPYAVGGRSAGAATGYTTGAWEYMTVPALTPPQGGDPKFQNVCLDFDSSGTPVVGYLGTNLEFGKQLPEATN